ncbi:MAG TPA: hypothetical protein VGJ13_04990 [Pseudonocardiaceae bacterium]|jgi:hypothetical protein
MCAHRFTPSPSPITPDADQASTIRLLEDWGKLAGVHVDASPTDEPAEEDCAADSAHGLGPVNIGGDFHCLLCSLELVSVVEHADAEVFRIPATMRSAAAAEVA